MQSIIASFLSAITTVTIFFQCLFGIGGLGFGKVVLKLEKDTYPVAAETIEAELYNCTFQPVLAAPYYYSLERWEADEWVPVKLKDSVIIPDAVILISPLRRVGKSFRLTDHDDLTAGRYRIQASGSVYAAFELV